jgi:cytochrome b subunit of formate dehydrogenase
LVTAGAFLAVVRFAAFLAGLRLAADFVVFFAALAADFAGFFFLRASTTFFAPFFGFLTFFAAFVVFARFAMISPPDREGESSIAQ